MSVYYDKQKKRWVIEITRDGRRIRKTAPAEASKKEAEAYEAQVVRDLWMTELGKKPEYTLDEALNKWLKEEVPGLKSQTETESHAGQLTPFIRGYKLSEVHECAEEYTKKNRHLSPATLYQRLAVLRRVARLAYTRWEWLDQPIHSKIKMPTVRTARHVYATWGEIITLLIAAPNQDVEDLVMLAFFTGMRRGEIMGLTQASVRGDVFYLGVETKTGMPRAVPIHPALADVVTRLPLRYQADWATRVFAELAESCGLGHVRLHDARHSFASLLIQSGESLRTVGELLGHTRAQTTARYTHLATEHLRTAVNRIGSKS
jgi:integrase